MRLMRSALGVAAAAALAACGPTVGDACTTDKDCGNGICFQGPTAPGGYCTLACQGSGGGSCPNGSVCSLPGSDLVTVCRKACATSQDCRAGYTCTDTRGSTRVCIGQ